MRHKFGLVAFVVSIAAGLAPASALASGTAQGPPAAPITTPFQQCAAVYQDPSCGYLIDITGASTSKVHVDPSIGYYEGSDDVLVGVQNDSTAPVSSIHVGVAGSGFGSFGFDGDGLCTPGGTPIPADCPFGPLGDPGDYFGPDATLTVDANPCPGSSSGPCYDDGTVGFPTPLQPGQYTYFSLEAPFDGVAVVTGTQNDVISTQMTDPSFSTKAHLTETGPTNVTDQATINPSTIGGNSPTGTVTYAVYSDPACATTPVFTSAQTITSGGSIPPSAAFGASLPNNATYYVQAAYSGDASFNAVTTNCGDETLTLGTPPTKPQATIATALVGANGASGATLTVATGTAVHDTAAVTGGGSPQSGRITYYIYSDSSCSTQVPGVSLGSGTAVNGSYPASNTVTLPNGTYYFQVIYSGNATYAGGRSACNEVLTVEPPCACAKISAYLSAFHVFGAGTTKLEFNLRSAIACTVGPGGCAGALTVTAPKGAAFVDSTKARNGATGIKLARSTATLGFRCAGPCAASTVQTPYTLQWLAFTTIRIKVGKGRHRHFKTVTIPNPRFLPNGRAKKTFTVTATEVCNGITTTRKLVIAFDKHGQVDYKKSDLNGDGLPDGGRLTDANGFI